MTKAQRKAEPTAQNTPTRLPNPFAPGRFDDNVWIVPVHAQGMTCNMTWASIVLADGSNLTSPGNRNLLVACKLYIYLTAQGKACERPLRGSSLMGEFQNCAHLIRWMSSRGLHSFQNLSLTHVVGYRNHVQRSTTSFKKRGGPRRASAKARKRLAPRTVAFRFIILKRLALLQGDMGEYGTRHTPAEIADLHDYLSVRVRAEEPTKAIPDEIFRPLLTSAINFIRDDAPNVFEFRAAIERWQGYRRDHLPERYSYRLWESPELLAIRAAGVPANLTVKCNGEVRDMQSLTHEDIFRLLTCVRGACFMIIAGLVGMRDSEIRSLKIGCMRSVRYREDGPTILKLAGTLYKTAKQERGVPAEWFAGYDEPDNPVRLAVEALERLPRSEKSTFLFAPMLTGRRNGERVNSTGSDKCLQEFVKWSEIEGWIFTAHQFRKTFARFVALSSVSSVFALMRHFKHTSLLMTEHYLSCDPEQLNDIFEATQEIVAEQLDCIFGAERLGGLAGRRIVENNAAFRGDANASARRELVQMEIADPSAYYRPMPLGMCIYDRALANCGGKIENVGLDMCINCNNFGVSISNLDNWLDLRALLNERIEEQSSLGFVSIELHRELEQAEDIIRGIVGDKDGSAA